VKLLNLLVAAGSDGCESDACDAASGCEHFQSAEPSRAGTVVLKAALAVFGVVVGAGVLWLLAIGAPRWP
jgi:hypothetical protein